jgi:hypothetical protein
LSRGPRERMFSCAGVLKPLRGHATGRPLGVATPSMNFHDAALDLEGLQQQLSSIREDVCITAVTAAKDLCEKLGIRVEGRIRRRKQMPGENARDAGLSAVEEITRIMKSVIDRLIPAGDYNAIWSSEDVR